MDGKVVIIYDGKVESTEYGIYIEDSEFHSKRLESVIRGEIGDFTGAVRMTITIEPNRDAGLFIKKYKAVADHLEEKKE